MPDRTLSSRLGQLALALLNATLLLAVLLVFGVWLLVGRLQHFASDTAEAAATALGADLTGQIQEQIGTLNGTVASLSTLDARLGEAIDRAGTGDSAAVAQLTGLRGDVQDLTAAITRLNDTAVSLRDQGGAALTDSFRSFLVDLAGRLGPLPQTPPAN